MQKNDVGVAKAELREESQVRSSTIRGEGVSPYLRRHVVKKHCLH